MTISVRAGRIESSIASRATDLNASSPNSGNTKISPVESTAMNRYILPICLLALTPVCAQDKPEPKRVVFVCEHGSAKSVIAATEFSRIARENGLKVDVLTRGTNPDAEVSKSIRD